MARAPDKLKPCKGLIKQDKDITVFDKCSDTEKLFIHYFVNETNGDARKAVLAAGITKDDYEATQLAHTFLNNKKLVKAIRALTKLSGVSPMALRRRAFELAMQDQDKRTALNAVKLLTDLEGMNKPKTVDVNVNVEFVREKLKTRLIDVSVEDLEQLQAERQQGGLVKVEGPRTLEQLDQ